VKRRPRQGLGKPKHRLAAKYQCAGGGAGLYLLMQPHTNLLPGCRPSAPALGFSDTGADGEYHSPMSMSLDCGRPVQ